MSTIALDQKLDVLEFKVKVPSGLSAAKKETIREGLDKALTILDVGGGMLMLDVSADQIADLIVVQTKPHATLVQDRIARMGTIKRIMEEDDWISAEDINAIHKADRPQSKIHPVSDWKRRGRIFSVPYGGKDYYARYQFDAMYQPLPVIKEIIEAYGKFADAWSLAAWFHFPNTWITKGGNNARQAVAPKDALDCRETVLAAARKRQGSYIA